MLANCSMHDDAHQQLAHKEVNSAFSCPTTITCTTSTSVCVNGLQQQPLGTLKKKKKMMASSLLSPGSTMLRILSSRAASVPIWSCRENDRISSLSPIPLLTTAKPTSMSPLLGVRFCSTEIPNSKASAIVPHVVQEVKVDIHQGLPHLTVPLPSRNEPCVFALKPVTHTIGDLVAMLRTEDPGIDRVVIRSTEGVRIASTTSIQTLMQSDFDLMVNDVSYKVQPPPFDVNTGLTSSMSGEELKRMGDVRALVGQLYEALHVEEYQATAEQKLVRELESMRDELAPLEDSRKVLAAQAERRTTNLTWIGLGLMSVQFGILARLTWWEYSWDIMEPVTYFVTYGTAIACYAYFVLTRQDYLLPDVADRQYLLNFHRRAKKVDWNVNKYNNLKEGITRVEDELFKLRDTTKLRPSNEALRKAAQDLESGILGGQVNIGSIRDMLKGKFSV